MSKSGPQKTGRYYFVLKLTTGCDEPLRIFKTWIFWPYVYYVSCSVKCYGHFGRQPKPTEKHRKTQNGNPSYVLQCIPSPHPNRLPARARTWILRPMLNSDVCHSHGCKRTVSVCLWLSIYLSVCPSVCRSVRRSVWLSVYLSTWFYGVCIYNTNK